MAKKISRKLGKKTTRKITQRKAQGFFSRIKLTDSYTSLILGAIVVLIVGILFVSFAKVNRNRQTSSMTFVPKTWEEISQDSNTSSTYTVNFGDDLWTISENVYHDGYRWVEIARINNLENPGIIHVGDKLTIPSPTPNVELNQIVQNTEQNSPAQNSVIQNNSITGNMYTVVKGDNLWDIAVRAYGDGFRWPEIAKANNLANPSLIHPGNVFIIPR